jgi:hypothetical protein
VLYLIKDEEFPADKDILARTERELKYCAEYLKRTGIHWLVDYSICIHVFIYVYIYIYIYIYVYIYIYIYLFIHMYT